MSFPLPLFSRSRTVSAASAALLALMLVSLAPGAAISAATGLAPRHHATGAHPRATPVPPVTPLNGAWRSLAIAGPQPAAGAALAWDGRDGLLFVFGGDSASPATGDLWAYRPAATKQARAGWTRLATRDGGPQPRAGAGLVWDSRDGVLLLFDGMVNRNETNEVWAYKPGREGTARGSWTNVTPGTSPLRRAYQSAVWDAADGVAIVFGGAVDGILAGDTWAYKPAKGGLTPGTWTRLAGSGPAARQGAVAVWDATDKLMFLSGGKGYGGLLSDLWAFRPARHGTAGSWTRLAATTPPGPRVGAAAAWDAANRRLLIFGGQVPSPALPARPISAPTSTSTATSTPTATSTSSTPDASTPTNTPTNTATATSTNTPTSTPTPTPTSTPTGPTGPRGVLVNGNTSYASDLWSFAFARRSTSSGAWKLLGQGGPAPRTSGAVYDTKDRAMLLFGGQSLSQLGDLWAYPTAGKGAGRWTLRDGGGPQARSGQAATWDSRDNVLLIFGGFSGVWLRDLWAYKAVRGGVGHWVLIALPNGPDARTEATLVWDSADNVALLFGGSNSSGSLGDVWAYRPAGDGTAAGSWTRLNVAGGPTVRHLHTAVWDPKDRQMLVFGGATATAVLGDLWAFRPNLAAGSGTWRPLMASTPLNPRFAHAAAWDPAQNGMLVFGGVNGSGHFLNDLWLYQPDANGGGSGWTSLGTPAGGAPDGRARAAMAWDAADNAAIIFGGNGLQSYRNDAYAYRQGAGWSPVTGTARSTPERRQGASAVYDTLNGGYLLFGGAGLGTALNDLWQLGGAQPPRPTSTPRATPTPKRGKR